MISNCCFNKFSEILKWKWCLGSCIEAWSTELWRFRQSCGARKNDWPNWLISIWCFVLIIITWLLISYVGLIFLKLTHWMKWEMAIQITNDFDFLSRHSWGKSSSKFVIETTNKGNNFVYCLWIIFSFCFSSLSIEVFELLVVVKSEIWGKKRVCN
jgi:hypothetical protein